MTTRSSRIRQTIDILRAKRRAEGLRAVQWHLDSALWGLDDFGAPGVWARTVEGRELRPGPELLRECGL